MIQRLFRIVSPNLIAHSANLVFQAGLFAAYATWMDHKKNQSAQQQLPSELSKPANS